LRLRLGSIQRETHQPEHQQAPGGAVLPAGPSLDRVRMLRVGMLGEYMEHLPLLSSRVFARHIFRERPRGCSWCTIARSVAITGSKVLTF
jgi:hypothetical protein